jgi:outer membrane protein TolC
MHRLPWIAVALLLGLGHSAARAGEDALTLTDLEAMARVSNPQVQAAYANFQAARQRVVQQDSNFWPQVSSEASWQKTRSEASSLTSRTTGEQLLAGISATQNLFNWSLLGASQSAELDAQSYLAQAEGVVNTVISQVRSAYLDHLTYLGLLEVAKAKEKDTLAALERAQALQKHGLAAPLDVAQAGLDLANAQLSVIQYQTQVRNSLATLAQAVGNPRVYQLKVQAWPTNPEPLVRQALARGEEELVGRGVSGRPEVRQMDLKARSAQAALESAQAGHYPTVQAQGSFGHGGRYDYNNEYYTYGLTLDLPIFTGFKQTATVREREELLRSAKSSLAQQEQAVGKEARQAEQGLNQSLVTAQVSASLLASAQENYRLVKGRYENGLSTPLEYSQARTQHFDALAQVEKARLGLLSALAEADRAVGGGLFPQVENQGR